MMIFVSDREENIVGKEENASYQHFLLYPQCLKKPFFCRAMKTRNYLEEGYTIFLLINTPGSIQNMDKVPLLCTQFAKQKVCSILYSFVF